MGSPTTSLSLPLIIFISLTHAHTRHTHTPLSPTALSSICAHGAHSSRNTLSLSLAKSYLPVKMELVQENSLPPPLPPLPFLQTGAGTLSLTKITIANSTAWFHSFPKHALLARKMEDFLSIRSPVMLKGRWDLAGAWHGVSAS